MTTRPPRRARSFTLLEVVLASLVGLLMILAAVQMVGGLESINQRLSVRARDQEQLDRMHLVLQRSLSTLVMSDAAMPPGRWRDRRPGSAAPGRSRPAEPAPAPTPTPTPTPTPGSNPDAGDPGATAAPGTETRPDPPPRLSLTLDQASAPSARSRSGALGWDAGSPPQALELVLIKPPIEPDTPEPLLRPSESSKEAGVPRLGPAGGRGLINADGLAIDIAAHRGVFELRPAPPTEGADRDAPPEWELWWRPIPPRLTDPRQAPIVPESFTAQPVRVAQHIRWAWFELFAARQKVKSDFSSTWVVDLPAYARFEVMTTSGLYADWLFELGWTVGPEYNLRTPAPNQQDPTQPAPATPFLDETGQGARG